MPKKPLCNLGKSINRKLDDLSETKTWLVGEVAKDSGLYFDDSYLHKIMTGVLATPKIIASISRVLGLDIPEESSA